MLQQTCGHVEFFGYGFGFCDVVSLAVFFGWPPKEEGIGMCFSQEIFIDKKCCNFCFSTPGNPYSWSYNYTTSQQVRD